MEGLVEGGLAYKEAIGSMPYLHKLAKEVELKKLQEEDKPIRDATDQLLIAAQGPKAFTYISPELTSALRVSNSITSKDPMRLTGVPSKSELLNALEKAEGARDKLMWKATGNGLKINAWSNSLND